jgi:putative ABC transport system permease protein
MNTFLRDLRYALRMLRKRPMFTAAVVLILAVGMGVSAALFSLIDACLIHSIPYPVADRWVMLRASLPQQNALITAFSVPELNDIGELRDIFEDVGAVHGVTSRLALGDYPESVEGTQATANAITMTGVRPLLGRTYTAEEDRPGGPSVVVLRYEFWQQRLAGDPAIVGKTVKLDGVERTVIGVMPETFELWGGQFWIPFQLERTDTGRSDRWFRVVAVLKPGVSEGRADARLRDFSAQLERQYKATTPEYAGMRLNVWNVKEAVTGGIRPALLVLLGAVGLLLLLSCANVANLLLARATARRREMAIRAALGASRSRLVRQMLVESLLLACAGGIAGLLIAVWLLPLLVHLIPPEWMTTNSEFVRVNYEIVFAVAGLSLLTGALFGLAPALQATRVSVSTALKEASSKISGDRRARLTRNALVVAELALAFVVLAGAALMIESYLRLEAIDLGFRPEHLLSFSVSLPQNKYAGGAQFEGFHREMLRRIAELPGVEGAAAVNQLPLGYRVTDIATRDITLEGRAAEAAGGNANASYRLVSPDYFKVAGIRLLRGRLLNGQDDENSQRVAVVNETMARLYWPDSDPVGQRMRLGTRYGHSSEGAGAGEQPVTIVGVVADSKQLRAIDAPVRQEFYLPEAQRAGETRDMSVLVRGPFDPAQLAPSVRRAVASIDPEQPVTSFVPMDQLVADSFGPKRLTVLLLGFFAVAALLLAVVGLYAILAYSVGERTHEIGLRIALGAAQRDVLRMVLRQGMTMALAGVGVGLAVSLALTRLMGSLLYGVSATDPLTFACVALLLGTVAFLACYVPARRATRVDPMVALRYE